MDYWDHPLFVHALQSRGGVHTADGRLILSPDILGELLQEE